MPLPEHSNSKINKDKPPQSLSSKKIHEYKNQYHFHSCIFLVENILYLL